jgi:nicotinamide riboside transporter PnuC
MIRNVELLSIIASLFEILALYLLTIKNKIGFLAGIACNICWVTYVVISHNAIGLILVSFTAFVLNIKGFLHWKKHGSEKKNKN